MESFDEDNDVSPLVEVGEVACPGGATTAISETVPEGWFWRVYRLGAYAADAGGGTTLVQVFVNVPSPGGVKYLGGAAMASDAGAGAIVRPQFTMPHPFDIYPGSYLQVTVQGAGANGLASFAYRAFPLRRKPQ